MGNGDPLKDRDGDGDGDGDGGQNPKQGTKDGGHVPAPWRPITIPNFSVRVYHAILGQSNSS